MTAIRNKPTLEGEAVGRQLARLTEKAREELVERLGTEAVANLLLDRATPARFEEVRSRTGARRPCSTP